jgi:hypothetical protein
MSIIAWIVGTGLGLFTVLVVSLVLFSAWTARQVEKRLPPRGRFIDVDGTRIQRAAAADAPLAPVA